MGYIICLYLLALLWKIRINSQKSINFETNIRKIWQYDYYHSYKVSMIFNCNLKVIND